MRQLTDTVTIEKPGHDYQYHLWKYYFSSLRSTKLREYLFILFKSFVVGNAYCCIFSTIVYLCIFLISYSAAHYSNDRFHIILSLPFCTYLSICMYITNPSTDFNHTIVVHHSCAVEFFLFYQLVPIKMVSLPGQTGQKWKMPNVKLQTKKMLNLNIPQRFDERKKENNDCKCKIRAREQNVNLFLWNRLLNVWFDSSQIFLEPIKLSE